MMPLKSDHKREQVNRLVEHRASFLNLLGAVLAIAGLVGCPLLFVVETELLPGWGLFTVAIVLIAIGIAFHLAARAFLKHLR